MDKTKVVNRWLPTRKKKMVTKAILLIVAMIVASPNERAEIKSACGSFQNNLNNKHILDISKVGSAVSFDFPVQVKGLYSIQLVFAGDRRTDIARMMEFTGDGSYTYYTIGPGVPRQLMSPQDGTLIEIAAKARKGEARIVYVKLGTVVPLKVVISDVDRREILVDEKFYTGAIISGGQDGIHRRVLNYGLDRGCYHFDIETLENIDVPDGIQTFIAVFPPRLK